VALGNVKNAGLDLVRAPLPLASERELETVRIWGSTDVDLRDFFEDDVLPLGSPEHFDFDSSHWDRYRRADRTAREGAPARVGASDQKSRTR
jgi:hypothetical protein